MCRRISGTGLFAVLLICLSVCRLDAASAAQGPDTRERILLFDSSAEFSADGTMRVTERITVLAAGNKIRRGIFRKLPRVWDRMDGKRFWVTYTILEVRRDGRPEPYREKEDQGVLTVRIGDADTLVEPGRHEYALTYEIRNHFSRFDDWDELYWNVTGNGWTFPIDAVRFHLSLPEAGSHRAMSGRDERIRSVDAYTGKAGEQGRDAEILPDGGVRTTAPLPVGGGLTVAYTWPREVLAGAEAPRASSALYHLFVPTPGTLPFWLPALGMALFYGFFLRRMRRQGGMPPIIPLYKAPEGLPPGTVRYIVKGTYDHTGFAADVLNLVAKGAVALRAKQAPARGQVLCRVTDAERRAGGRVAALSDEENWVIGTLFPNGVTELDPSTPHDKGMIAARTRRRKTCAAERKVLFRPWFRWFLVGLAGMLAVPLLCGALYNREVAIFIFFGAAFLAVGGVCVAQIGKTLFAPLENLWHLPFRAFPLLTMIGVALFACVPFIAFFWRYPPFAAPAGFAGALLASAAATLLFFLVAPRRTALGRERLATAKGLALYLGTAERRRYEALYPPEELVAHFEALLPYALALDVGKTWADAFAGHLAAAGLKAENFRDVSWKSLGEFRGDCRRSSVSRSTSTSSGSGFGRSSSGSGSSGRGSSGGGSGGGGGGGW